MQLTQSHAWGQRAEKVLAGGPATLSKHPSRYPATAPTFLMRGDGARVWDMDGNVYLDCVAALGPILLGHNHPRVRDAVQRQAGCLTSSTLSTRLEVECAELLTSIIPGAEMVRFATNGKDVTEAAIKLARYVTGKSHVIYCGYSGGYPDYLSTTDKDGGVLALLRQYNHQVPWRDFAALENALEASYYAEDGSYLAAIILEVPPELPDVTREDTAATICRYANAAHQAGALFILDEVVTGFRYALGGAHAYYGVEADLCTFSKALGNGLPISAITGPRDLMRAFEGGQVFLSTTFGGNGVSLAACKATLRTLIETDAHENLQTYGAAVHQNVLTELAFHDLPATVRGNFARFVIDWRGIEGIATADELRTLWLQELLKRGILAGVPYFPMTCYDLNIVMGMTTAVTAACEVLSEVVTGKKAISDALTCPVIQEVFHRYERQT